MPLQQWRVSLFERGHFWSKYYLLQGFPSSSVGKCRRPQFDSWVGKILWRRDRLPTPVFWGFPCGSAGKESPFNAGDLASIPGLARCSEEGEGYPLQYSHLENSMDCIVMGSQSQTWLSLSLLLHKWFITLYWGILLNSKDFKLVLYTALMFAIHRIVF